MPDYKLKHKRNCAKKIFSFLFLFLLVKVTFASQFYWENPVTITDTNTQFPKVINTNKDNCIFWQEVDEKEKNIYITCRKYTSLKDFTDVKRFIGPISYSAEVPDLYSVTVLKNGNIAVAALTGTHEITIAISKDKGTSFTCSKIKTKEIMVAPRIYATYRDTLVLFTSVGDSDSFRISYSESKNGEQWSDFKSFEPSSSLRNPFIPYLSPITDDSGNTGDLVVFQSQYLDPKTNRFSFQLYSTYYDNSTQKWTSPVLLTDQTSLSNGENKSFNEYQNQNPLLYSFNKKTYLVWERMESVSSVLKIAEITKSGIVPKTVDTVSNQGSATRGNLFNYNDNLCLVWFDTRRGRESVYMAELNGSYWDEVSLVENKNSNLFGCPVLVQDKENPDKKILSFIWQQKTANEKNTIGMLAPDKSVLPAGFNPISYKKGSRSAKEDVVIQINFPEDSSNIAGYSYTWTKKQPGNPPKQIEHFTKEKQIKEKAVTDGEYYLTIRVQDYAGNWSEPSSILYYLDLTPPTPPVITLKNTDKHGFIDSNTFSLSWNNSPESDVAEYSYRIDLVGDIPKELMESKKHPLNLSEKQIKENIANLNQKYQSAVQKNRKMLKNNTTKVPKSSTLFNKQNGVYVLSVFAIDEVGNVSEPSTKLFILNKYEPETFISSVSLNINEDGNNVLAISGGGFKYDGIISKIFIDSDGKEPYDLILEERQNQYKIQSDSYINNVNIGADLEPGTYRIGLLHTDRGLFMSKNILRIDQSGTVKIEAPFSSENQYKQNIKTYKYRFIISLFVAVLVILIICFVILFSLGSYAQSGYEQTVTGKEVKALLKGDIMPMKKLSERLHPLPSLKRTVIRFTYFLIVLVVVVVTYENAQKLVKLQKNTMASGLQNRVEVLLESLASGVKNFFPSNNILELSALPGQKDAMSEVKYVTILGQPQDSDSSDNLNYIWATNDPEINDKIDSYSFEIGESQITDPVILDITKKYSEFDKKIKDEITPLSNQINELNNELMEISIKDTPDRDSLLESVSGIQAGVRNQLDAKLQELAKEGSGSYPYFNSEDLDENQTDYIFYRPVTYRHGNSGNYVHGIVYLEVSTQELIDSLHRELKKSIIFGLLVAIAAMIVGIIGAYIFATLLVKPIKKLESHVNMIGRTKNKINLKGKDIELTTKNEVGRLGDAINNMAHELVQVAVEEELAMDGKAVQKAFLPLLDLGGNNKATTAELNEKDVQCYGYYEGESGVSGDYFDYKRLDNEWFVIIKCDASGHGIPAAIIMTVVATLFRRFFENWSFKKNGTKLEGLVGSINDFIESLGLKGKFATMIICLLNLKTGELYMCNAGDNLVHIFDSKTKKVKILTLNSTPTAGVFTTDLVDMRGGFKVEKTILNRGDVLFLYTDGIEESTRRIREADFTVRQNDVEVKRMDPKTHQEVVEVKTEDAKEEFGPERVCEIIEAIFNKQKYTLTKQDNPMQGETLEFDFTKGDASLREVILGLASTEKVFRLYKTEDVPKTEYIRIDKKIDEYLSQYFNRYDFYAEHKTEIAGNISYVDYESMLEDEQSDDLTLLAIKRL